MQYKAQYILIFTVRFIRLKLNSKQYSNISFSFSSGGGSFARQVRTSTDRQRDLHPLLTHHRPRVQTSAPEVLLSVLLSFFLSFSPLFSFFLSFVRFFFFTIIFLLLLLLFFLSFVSFSNFHSLFV